MSPVMGDEMFRRPSGGGTTSFRGHTDQRSIVSGSSMIANRSRHRVSSRLSESGSVSGATPRNKPQMDRSHYTESLLASVFDQVSPVTPDRTQRSRRGQPGSSAHCTPANMAGSKEYLAYSSDEEYEQFMQQPRTDYTYARSVSYNSQSPERVGPPSMSRVGLHSPGGDSLTQAANYRRAQHRSDADQFEKMSTQVFSYRREITSYEAAPASTGRGGGDTPVRHVPLRVTLHDRGLHAVAAGLDQDSADEDAIASTIISDSLSHSLASQPSPGLESSSAAPSSRAGRITRSVTSALLWPLLQLCTLVTAVHHRVPAGWWERQTEPSPALAPGTSADADYLSARAGHRYRLRSTPQRAAMLTQRHSLNTRNDPPAAGADTRAPRGEFRSTQQSQSHTSAVRKVASYVNPMWWVWSAVCLAGRSVAAAGLRLNTVSGVRSSPVPAGGWPRLAGMLLTTSAAGDVDTGVTTTGGRDGQQRNRADVTWGTDTQGRKMANAAVGSTEEVGRSGARRRCYYLLLPLLLLMLLILLITVAMARTVEEPGVSLPLSVCRLVYAAGVSAAAAACCSAELASSVAVAALTTSAQLLSSLACLLISATLTSVETGYLFVLGLLSSAAGTLSGLAVLLTETVACVTSSIVDSGSDVTDDVVRSAVAVMEVVPAAAGALGSTMTSVATTAGAAAFVGLRLLWAPLAGVFGAVTSAGIGNEVPVPVDVAQIETVAPPVPLADVQSQLLQLQTQMEALEARHKSCSSAASARSAQMLDARRHLTSHMQRVTSRLAEVTSASPQRTELERVAVQSRESGERSRRLAEEVAKLERDIRQLHATLRGVQESLHEARTCCNSSQPDWGSLLSVRLQNVSRLLDERVQLHTAALKQELTSAGGFVRGAAGGISRQEALTITQHQLALYDADKTGKFDFALESAGGSIISTQCTEAYTVHAAQYSLLGVPLWHTANNPRSIIQPSSRPGECFAFRGEGVFVVGLSRPVRATEVVLEHIARELTPERRVDSAPRHFSLLGVADSDEALIPLGEFEYDAQAGPPLQQFTVRPTDGRPLSAVHLRVHSNWGEPEYTCLYRFRVHGDVMTQP